MSEHLEAYVNNRDVTVYSGMKVQHALVVHDPDIYEMCRKGRATVRTQDGFSVGLEGALQGGVRLLVARKK
jgi:hypothetical protein